MKNAKPRRRSPDEILASIRELAASYGGSCETATYQPLSEQWWFRCSEGHRFSLVAHALERDGAWCPKCEIRDRIHSTAAECGAKCTTKAWNPTAQSWSFVCSQGHHLRLVGQNVLQNGVHCARCEKQKLVDEVHQRAVEIGAICLTKKWRRRGDHWRFRCANGHTFSRIAAGVLERGLTCDKCAQLDRLNEIQAKAAERGGLCLDKKPKPVGSKFSFRCEKNHLFELAGDRFLGENRWCPTCRKENTLQRAQSIAAAHGGKCLEQDYKKVRESWRFRCEYGHEFTLEGRNVLWANHWCPVCSKTAPGSMYDFVSQYVTEKGGKLISKRYQPSPSKLEFECEHGHRWRAVASHIVHSNHWCPTCAALPTPAQISAFDEAVKKRGGTLLSEELGQFTDLHQFRCAKGHLFEQRPSLLVNKGYWCKQCGYDESAKKKRRGIDVAIDEAEKRGGKLLTTECKSFEERAEWECARGHQWWATFKSVIYNETWCRQCFDLDRRGPPDEPYALPRQLSIEDCHSLAAQHGGLCLNEYYVNYMEPVAWRCKRKHEFLASLHSMEARDNFCTECAEIERKEHWLSEAKAYARDNGGVCHSSEWISATSKLEWSCDRGHHFNRSWNNAIIPPFCSVCAREKEYQEKGAERLKAIASRNGGTWIASEYEGARAKYRFLCANAKREFLATPLDAERRWDQYCGCDNE